MKACPFVTVVVASLLAWLNAGLVKAQTTVALLEYTNVWRYQTNTNAPGYLPADAWTASAFNDQTWPSGPGLFGFETSPAIPIVFAPIHTMILPPVAGGPISSYFRTHFDWRGPLDFVVLDFASAVDDGMIVYLNGRELLAFNMPPAPRPMVWDLAVLPGGPNPLGEGVPVVTNIVPSNLREGDNVIAVELHQHLFTTGDDLFGMKLTATFPQAPVNLAPDEPSNRVVLANRDFTMIVRASASPPPDYRWFGNGEPIPGATGSSYTV
ncbi:MAG TPA: immunoglobulin domain-containing protein, partial [Candidatus Dormibacteraeota bacterium]|nr:immunoglobulin domain-containing protein [Candidatus Dormibacteraeota bacterium]